MAGPWSRGGGGAASAAAFLVLALLTCAPGQKHVAVSGAAHYVGDRMWRPGVNYTEWAARNRFYVHDWLVFFYEKGMYDVMQVNETAYNRCLSDDPIVNWSRGRSFAFELNNTGHYYFICSRGYCYHGMKLSILVEPLPEPAPTPSPLPSGADSGSLAGSSFRNVNVWAVAAAMAWASLF